MSVLQAGVIAAAILAAPAACLFVGVPAFKPGAHGQPATASSLQQPINAVKRELIQASSIAALRKPAAEKAVMERAVARLVQEEVRAFLSGRPSRPPDPALQWSLMERQQAFRIVQAQVENAIALHRWTVEDMTAIAPHLPFLAEEHRIILAEEFHSAVKNRQLLAAPGLMPPF